MILTQSRGGSLARGGPITLMAQRLMVRQWLADCAGRLWGSGASVRPDDARLVGDDHGVDAGPGAGLRQHLAAMGLGGGLRQHQLLRGLTVGQPLRYTPPPLPL